jgi:Xaa-Pro aminopeptidase
MGVPEYMRFPIEEYQQRHNRARELMERKNLKGLFITEGGNYTYFSGGGRDTSFSRPHVILLPRNGAPVAIIQHFPSWNRKREIWFDDVRVYDTMLGLPVEMAVEAMREVGMAEGQVGAELGYEQRLGISFSDFLKLKELLPKVEFVDTADIFWSVRMIKSQEEISRHRRACQITVQAYDALFPSLREGMSEREILDRFLKLQVDLGGLSPWGYINSGPENYNSIGGGPSARRIEKGNQVWLDGGCSFREYRSDFCCAGTVGPPSDEQKRMQQMVAQITRTVTNAVRPGIRACDLDALNHTEWEKWGYDYSKINWAGGRIGHGMGWGVWSNEPPHIANYDTTEIQPGMAFTIEPGINTEYGCYQTEIDLVVTKDGCEVLNEMDRELRIIPA